MTGETTKQERAAALHALIAEKAAKDALETPILPGDHTNPTARAFGANMKPRVCATPDCGCLTEGAVLEPRVPTPWVHAGDAVMAYFSRYCERCIAVIKGAEIAEEKAKAHAAAKAARLAWWEKAWGGADSRYHDTALDKIPDKAAAEKALRWTPEHPKGLLLLGDTGAGKTRTVYLLLHRILLETGIRPMIKKCAKLRHEIAKAAKSDDENARPRLMRSMIEAPILYLDDLGQMAASDSLGEALFDIIEERTQLGRPIIATSQSSGEEFTSKFNDENQGVALARRLSDCCYRVNFTRPKNAAKMEEPPLTLL